MYSSLNYLRINLLRENKISVDVTGIILVADGHKILSKVSGELRPLQRFLVTNFNVSSRLCQLITSVSTCRAEFPEKRKEEMVR